MLLDCILNRLIRCIQVQISYFSSQRKPYFYLQFRQFILFNFLNLFNLIVFYDAHKLEKNEHAIFLNRT